MKQKCDQVEILECGSDNKVDSGIEGCIHFYL